MACKTAAAGVAAQWFAQKGEAAPALWKHLVGAPHERAGGSVTWMRSLGQSAMSICCSLPGEREC